MQVAPTKLTVISVHPGQSKGDSALAAMSAYADSASKLMIELLIFQLSGVKCPDLVAAYAR